MRCSQQPPTVYSSSRLVPIKKVLRADNIVSDEVRRQIEAREQALQQSEEAPAMTAPQAADYKRQLAALMQPGESVTEALRRLRPPPSKGAKRGRNACHLPACCSRLSTSPPVLSLSSHYVCWDTGGHSDQIVALLS